MDNISEFILHTTKEAQRRGLEISIASVSLAKPVEMPAAKTAQASPATQAPKIVEDHSWISVPEAARMLHCSTNAFYTRIRLGKIDGHKNKAGRWMIPSHVIATFRKSHSRTAVPVRCVQTGVTYPSLTAAAKALRTDVTTLSLAIAAHRPCKNLTFEKVNP